MSAIALLTASAASADAGLLVGVAADELKWEPAPALEHARALGVDTFRVHLGWHPGLESPTALDDAAVARALLLATGGRILLNISAPAAEVPLDPSSRDQFCSYARNLLRQFPELNDIEIDNEPNSKNFWRPQFGPDGSPASPAAYELLLARCYDVLHAERPDVNVVAFSTANRGTDNPRGATAGLSPGSFIAGVGAAYRASLRSRPIFDTVSHHPYPLSSRERPSQQHRDPRVIGEGDWNRLMQALFTAFAGTAQPLPGQCGSGRCVEIWYSEDGFQTEVDDDKAGLYDGTENALTIPTDGAVRDQGFQLGSALRIAYCQPFVGAFFNFELVDEARLSGWQSGLFWPDWTPKQSVADFASAVGAVTSDRVDCSRRRYRFTPDDTTGW